jgi:tripartite-type tricarboxylate transporter receptor subunit TctC
MSHSRRPALSILATLTFAAGLPAVASAQAQAQAQYPSQTIRFIVPAGAGGLPDTIARIVGRKLQDKVGQSVVVENRPGGNGAVSVAALMALPADGHHSSCRTARSTPSTRTSMRACLTRSRTSPRP